MMLGIFDGSNKNKTSYFVAFCDYQVNFVHKITGYLLIRNLTALLLTVFIEVFQSIIPFVHKELFSGLITNTCLA